MAGVPLEHEQPAAELSMAGEGAAGAGAPPAGGALAASPEAELLEAVDEEGAAPDAPAWYAFRGGLGVPAAACRCPDVEAYRTQEQQHNLFDTPRMKLTTLLLWPSVHAEESPNCESALLQERGAGATPRRTSGARVAPGAAESEGAPQAEARHPLLPPGAVCGLRALGGAARVRLARNDLGTRSPMQKLESSCPSGCVPG